MRIISRRAWSWIAAVVVALGAFLYGAVAEGPPKSNADRAHELAQRFACPVCAGQSVAESDVSVAREIRRQIAVWVDDGRSDDEIRRNIVAVYGTETDYNPPASGLSSLVWILPLVAGGGIGAVLVLTLRSARRQAAAKPGGPEGAALGPGGRGHRAAIPQAAAKPGSPAARSRSPRRRWRTAAAVTAAVVLFTTAAGVFVARFSGSRGVGESLTGEIRVTARELNFRALDAFNNGDIDAAISLYDEALGQQPSNAEALTYRGWLTSRRGDSTAAAAYLDDAIASDPDYSDARLFRAIVALESGDAGRAATELAVFDSLDPSPDARTLVEQARVRERVADALGAAALARVDAVYSQPDRAAFADSGLTIAETLAAAEARASQGCEGCLLEALQMIDWLLESHPGEVDALAARGWLLARTGEPELVQLSIEYLNEALSVEPHHPSALVYRAIALSQTGNLSAAKSDLNNFDALDDPPPSLVSLAQTLRETLGP